MFLKHRNLLAWLLLAAAALSWVYGQELAERGSRPIAVTETTAFPAVDTVPTTIEWSEPAESEPQPYTDGKAERTAGFLLGFLAVLFGGFSVFYLKQTAPVFGPDMALWLIAAAKGFLYFWGNRDYLYFYGFEEAFRMLAVHGTAVFFMLLSLRELWGWIAAKAPLAWCAVQRLAGRFARPQAALLMYVGWIGFGLAVLILAGRMGLMMAGLSGAAMAFGVLCLWRYGSDLNHFQNQLECFKAGMPIAVQEGAFRDAEHRLLEVQVQHEEAIQKAITGERFRVELIANVSHDLRTPLTAILGYGELLEKETLSPEGKEQLFRLNQKAGYMRELVDDLFELTKVSSGAAEARKNEIDLIRLLEQTIGLFDDQLNAAGLAVRRHYAAEAMPIVTDGARMHQVFANLLTNAIKYAVPGTRIHLEVMEQEQTVRIRMVNTASYEMDFTSEEIVQRFARGDKARSTKGSGLGLAIAQTYTESVGGSFRVSIDGDQFSAIVELPKL